jgi:hypothetical protein
MNPSSPEALEGRILAQRKILVEILSRLAQSDAGLLDALEERTVFRDHEEDPGVADVSPEFAIEAAIAEEVRLIVQSARGRSG